MEPTSKEHDSEHAEYMNQPQEEINSIGEEVPHGYYRSPIFLGTMLAIGLGMFSVRLPFHILAFRGVESYMRIGLI
jgi:hypothetical protein